MRMLGGGGPFKHAMAVNEDVDAMGGVQVDVVDVNNTARCVSVVGSWW